MYIQGFSQSQIANKLNEMGELTPKEYKGLKLVAGKWTQEGSKRSWGEGIATALEGFGMYYPTTPNWSLDIANAGRGEITTDFYLINKDEKWMLRNYKFMHALFSGTQFVMLNHSIVQSPNVYNVVVPGRFEIVWASVTMSATMEGKLRKCS